MLNVNYFVYFLITVGARCLNIPIFWMGWEISAQLCRETEARGLESLLGSFSKELLLNPKVVPSAWGNSFTCWDEPDRNRGTAWKSGNCSPSFHCRFLIAFEG